MAIAWRACRYLRSIIEEDMIAATRMLRLMSDDAEKHISVRIFVPELGNDKTWWCYYEIDWPEGTWKSRAGGVDSAQALFLAMQMIGSDIYTSSYHKSGKLFLDRPGEGYGFPVPSSLRDLLVGDDKKYM
jgi:hypothetical protein